MHFFAPYLIRGEKIEIVRAAVIKVKKSECAPTSEEEPLLLREPRQEKVALERGAGFRVFPVHALREEGAPREGDDAPAWD